MDRWLPCCNMEERTWRRLSICHRFSGEKRCTSWQILSVKSGLNSVSQICTRKNNAHR